MPKNKGLDRGGVSGQEGELSPGGGSPAADDQATGGLPASRSGPRGSVRDRLDWRDQQKQRGGVSREPDLDDKHDIQPTHQVD